MNPAWIAPAAKLAHELGLHVHGHIPAGMRTLDAVNAGYDEITHIYFATMQAMPRRGRRQVEHDAAADRARANISRTSTSTPSRRKTVIRTLAEKQIARRSDAGGGRGRADWPRRARSRRPIRPYVGTLPPATERGFKSRADPAARGHDARRRQSERQAYGRICRGAAQGRRADRRRHRRQRAWSWCASSSSTSKAA